MFDLDFVSGETNSWFCPSIFIDFVLKKIEIDEEFYKSVRLKQIKYTLNSWHLDQSIKFWFFFYLQISHCGIGLTDHDYFVIFINFHTLGHELLSCVVPPLTKRPTLTGGGGNKRKILPPPPPQVQQRMLRLEIKIF